MEGSWAALYFNCGSVVGKEKTRWHVKIQDGVHNIVDYGDADRKFTQRQSTKNSAAFVRVNRRCE